MTKDQLTQLVFGCLPYPNQITELDTTKDSDAIRFKWRSTSFRVTTSLFAEEVEGGLLVSSDKAILLKTILIASKGFNRSQCPT
jgi:hypothetical protein